MSTPTLNETTKSFTEYLFFEVLGNKELPDDDIAKKFAKANQSQIAWPVSATTFEELETFFNDNAVQQLASVARTLAASMATPDFEAYTRLLEQHTKQILAYVKSSLFALRTVWNDYTKAYPQTH